MPQSPSTKSIIYKNNNLNAVSAHHYYKIVSPVVWFNND